MVGREDIETCYKQLKTLKAEISASKDMLEKNRAAISVNGEIPDKYKRAFNKLDTSIKEMETQYDALIRNIAPLEKEYVLTQIFADLYLQNDKGGKYFVEKAYALKETRAELIRKAECSFDIDALDDILLGLRNLFIEKEWENYKKYAQTLSFNKAVAVA